MFRLSRTRNLCKLDTFIRVYQCVVRYIYMYRDFRQQQLNYVRCIAAMWLIGNVFRANPFRGESFVVVFTESHLWAVDCCGAFGGFVCDICWTIISVS